MVDCQLTHLIFIWPCSISLDNAQSHLTMLNLTWPCSISLAHAQSHLTMLNLTWKCSNLTWPCSTSLDCARSCLTMLNVTLQCLIALDPALTWACSISLDHALWLILRWSTDGQPITDNLNWPIIHPYLIMVNQMVHSRPQLIDQLSC